jgi:serine/threonine protein kinase
MEQILKNKYRINYKIATGKFTIIYNGTDLNKNEEIAIKEFPQEIKDNIFNNYLNLLQKLKGNNSINLIDNFKENNKYYIIMELCDSNLYEFIEQNKNGLELPLILKILNQLNVALKNIKFYFLVYNYINPKDILIKYKDSKSKDFDIKLTGYLTGIILKNEINFDNYLLYYKAPELVGKKIDIWSLGITIYYMYYKEIDIKKIKKNNLFLMNKKLNNINFKDLLSRLLNVDDKKKLLGLNILNIPSLQIY